MSDFSSRPPTAQSLPATPSAATMRTFTDYSGEHTRLTTLHGSTGALEVNNLGGFKLGPPGVNSSKFANALESSIDGIVRTNPNVTVGSNEYGSSGLNGQLRNGRSNGTEHLGLGHGLSQGLMPKHTSPNMGMTMSPGGIGGPGMGGPGMGGSGMNQFHSNMGMQQGHMMHHTPPGVVTDPAHGGELDDMADVFTGLSFKEPSMVAAPGYGRIRPRRASAPVGVNGGEHAGGFGAIGPQNGYGLWGANENPLPPPPPPEKGLHGNDFPPPTTVPTSRNSPTQQYPTSGSYSAGIGPHPTFNTAWANGGQANNVAAPTPPVPATSANANKGSIWSQGSGGSGNSRPNSQTSSYSNDSSIQSSPIYSPTNSSSGFVGFLPTSSSCGVSSSNDTSTSLGMGLLTTTPLGVGLGEERSEARSPFRVCDVDVWMCACDVMWMCACDVDVCLCDVHVMCACDVYLCLCDVHVMCMYACVMCACGVM